MKVGNPILDDSNSNPHYQSRYLWHMDCWSIEGKRARIAIVGEVENVVARVYNHAELIKDSLEQTEYEQ